MRRFTALLLALIITPIAFAPYTEVYPQRESSLAYVPGQVLVKLRQEAVPTVSQAERPDAMQLAEAILPESGVAAQALDADGQSGLYLVQLDDNVSVEDAIRAASSDPRVEYAEPDYLLYPAVTHPNDSRFNEMWGLYNDGLYGKAGADIGATRAWDLTQGSDDVVVAVVDTGVDLTHPDLAPNAWVNPREVAGDGVDNDNNGLTDDINGWNFLDNSNRLIESPQVDAHGTHVAGTIGAVGNNSIGTAGVAWRVKIMSLKFLGSNPGTSSVAVKAIKYARDQKKLGVNVRVINASWGGPGDSQSLHDAIKGAGKDGILFVCAAGNGGSDRRGDDIDVVGDYPSGWSPDTTSIISVTALDWSDSLPSFSNYGYRSVTVAAPGTNILSTVPGGGWTTMGGTSMATPHVSGVAALLASYSPSLTPEQIRERIARTSEPVLSIASRVACSGRVNAYNALTDSTAPAAPLAVGAIQTAKKYIYVDGLGFVNGSAVVEVNGAALPRSRFDDSYALPSNTCTRLSVKLGKSGVKSTFPQGVQVTVTLYNPATGERSAPFFFTKR